MDRRVSIPPLVIWLGLLAAASVAPPTRPDVWEWALRLLRGDTAGENPSMVAFFQAMGLWPVLWAVLLVDELLPAEAPRSWRDRVPAWPFVLLANALGMFVLGVYLLLRAPDRRPARPRAWIGWLGSRPVAGLLVGAAGLLMIRFLQGDLPALAQVVRTEGFAFTMVFDFLALSAAAAWWLTVRLGPLHAGWLPLLGRAVGALQLALQRAGASRTV